MSYLGLIFALSLILNLIYSYIRFKKINSKARKDKIAFYKLIGGIVLLSSIPVILIVYGEMKGIKIRSYFILNSTEIIIKIFQIYVLVLAISLWLWINFFKGDDFLEKYQIYLAKRGENEEYKSYTKKQVRVLNHIVILLIFLIITLLNIN